MPKGSTKAQGRDALRAAIRTADDGHPPTSDRFTVGDWLEVLGHSDCGTTLKVYAHLDPKRAKAAAGRIDAALGRNLPALEDVAT